MPMISLAVVGRYQSKSMPMMSLAVVGSIKQSKAWQDPQKLTVEANCGS